MLIESSHTLEVSELPFKKAKVTDKLQATDDPAYGPQKVRALRDKPENGRYAATKDVLLGPIENADSYAWFVVVSYPRDLSRDLSALICGSYRRPTFLCSATRDLVHLPRTRWLPMEFARTGPTSAPSCNEIGYCP